mgnify:CR=1 FL=1
MKRKFLIFAMFLFAFSIGYAANGNEEFLKANEYYEKNDVSIGCIRFCHLNPLF